MLVATNLDILDESLGQFSTVIEVKEPDKPKHDLLLTLTK